MEIETSDINDQFPNYLNGITLHYNHLNFNLYYNANH